MKILSSLLTEVTPMKSRIPEISDQDRIWYILKGYEIKIGPSGTRYWYLNGKYHREDGFPAIEWADGHREWYLNDKVHREDGPAIEYANGDQEWYLNNVRVSPHE